MTRQFTLLAATVGVLALGGSASAGPILDDFTTQLAGGSTGGGGLLSSAASAPVSSGAQAVGGHFSATRTVTVDNNNPASGSSSIGIAGAPTNTVDLATSAANTNGSLISLAYTLPTSDLSGISGLQFEVSIFDAGTNAGDLPTVQVFINDVSSGVQSTPITFIPNSTVPFSVVIPFDTLDRNQVTGITVQYSLNQGEDIVLSNVNGGLSLLLRAEAVPEPATLAVLGLFGAAGLIRVRRRRAAAADSNLAG